MESSYDHRAVLKKTIWPSPHIQQILLCKNAVGIPTVVVVKDRSLYILGRHIPLPAQVRHSAILNLEYEDLICLSLSSGWVVFLRIYEDQTIPVVIKSIAVGKGTFEGIEGLGYSVKTEPKADSFAVTAFQDRIALYTIDKDSTKSENDSALFECHQRTTILLEGCTIIDSCFLFPLVGSMIPSHCFYVILFARPDSKLNIRLYEWWTDKSIHAARLYGTLPLPYDVVVNFIIPIKGDSTGLIVVTYQQFFLVTVSDILSGHTSLTRYSFESTPTCYYRDPLTTNIKSGDDHVYVMCEDGNIFQLHISSDGKVSTKLFCRTNRNLGNCMVMQSISETGDLLLDLPIEESSLILLTYGGDYSIGGSVLLSVDPEDSNKVEQQTEEIFGNWSPISDFAVVSRTAQQGRRISNSTPLVFACTGYESTGAISHFQYGIKTSIFMHGPPMKGVINIFLATTDNGGPDIAHILFISYPWETKVYIVDVEEGVPEFRELESNCGAIFNAETLGVKTINNSKWILQITKDKTIITDLETETVLQTNIPGIVTRVSIVNDLILFVTVDDDNVRSDSGEVLISVYKMETKDDSQSQINKNCIDVDKFNYNLPTCLKSISKPLREKDSILAAAQIAEIKGHAIVILGYTNPSIHIYMIKEDNLKLEARIEEVIPADDDDAVPYNFFINETDQPTVVEILVGLRNGCYICFDWDWITKDFVLKTVRKVGHSPVEITKVEGTSSLIIRSGQVYVLDITNLSSPPSKLVLDSDKKVSMDISCLCHAPAMQDSLCDYIITMMNSKLRFLKLNKQTELIVRQLFLGSTPRKILYLDFVGLLAVAVTGGSDVSDQLCNLIFVDPFKFEVIETYWAIEGGQPNSPFAPNETIYSMCEWSFTSNEKLYRFLVVGSGTDNKQAGIIRLLRVQRSKSNTVKLTVQHYWTAPGPVFAIGQFGISSIMYAFSENGGSVVTISRAETFEDKYAFFFSNLFLLH